MRYSVSRASIEIRAEKITQLFDTLDPLPYPQKDLAETTENFIVGWPANCRGRSLSKSWCMFRRLKRQVRLRSNSAMHSQPIFATALIVWISISVNFSALVAGHF